VTSTIPGNLEARKGGIRRRIVYSRAAQKALNELRSLKPEELVVYVISHTTKLPNVSCVLPSRHTVKLKSSPVVLRSAPLFNRIGRESTLWKIHGTQTLHTSFCVPTGGVVLRFQETPMKPVEVTRSQALAPDGRKRMVYVESFRAAVYRRRKQLDSAPPAALE
jgi:hypothetical protein